MSKAHYSEKEPIRRYSRQEIRRNRIKVGSAAAATTLLLLAGSGKLSSADDGKPETRSADEQTVCEPGGKMQEFTFLAGDGRNDAIFTIDGSGKGKGDPCWTEAEAEVDRALDGRQPQYGQTIQIHSEVHPVDQQIGE